MPSYSATSSPLSPLSGSVGVKSTTGNHAKLHRRGGSGSLPGPPSPFTSNANTFTTPFATYEEQPFPDLAALPQSSSSTPKIKPYLRKMSSAKEDQGTIDLSKSMAENDRLAGLGIQDFAPKSAADVSFAHTGRRHHHGRTTSVGSQISNGSGSLKPGQPFTHPMTKTPRPYTPPAGRSYASSVNDDEANEGDDVVENEFGLGPGFRSKRSMSISSTPQTNPTPLSQSHTASDLGLVPKLTSTSQSNLSIRSNQSGKSGKSKLCRPRRNTDRSDYAPSPSSRTSFDRPFGFGRRSDTEPQSRDQRIQEARRKFEEKEADKDRKAQKEAAKRRESEESKSAKKQRKQSDAQDKPHAMSSLKQLVPDKPRKSSTATATGGAEQENVFARSYEDYRPAHAASLPRYGTTPGQSEKAGQVQFSTRASHDHSSDGGWMRFSTWLQTRMLSCGGSRA
ncbi:hypothetical protein AC578_5713 [Pseudocercospora eumusae]|uniref:Uncharacterized protein n=1 Tax=Pseudocercospora eumusae TaxID=321146 RepID=A0A139HEQ1_9PEZI|nr:hypothetical protein AC578_5713 [Pseudocercospora eumusae]